jgi:hypothetical protein
MCYSKEVSLLTTAVISAGSAVSLIKVSLARTTDIVPKVPKAFSAFSRNAILGFFCIGVHQFGEYLSIETGNQWIYKAGLVASASCMYFLMRSLEALIGRRFGSRGFLLLLGALAIQIALKPMSFENMHFWVRGYSHVVWSGVWMAMFLYWNVAVLFVRSKMPSATNRRLLLTYPFWVLNVSWLLCIAYALSAVIVQGSPASIFPMIGPDSAIRSFQVVHDLPSIWCAFVAIHAILIPIFVTRMRQYDFSASIPDTPLPIGRCVAAAAVLWVLTFATWPFMGVSLKMLTQ